MAIAYADEWAGEGGVIFKYFTIMTYEDERNEFVDIEPYLIPETRILLSEIELRTPDKVKLRKVYDDTIKTWHIRTLANYHIDMPANDEGNIISFTHELLHIYFDYVLGMMVNHFTLPFMIGQYNSFFENPTYLTDHYISLINNLQHHKMIPYFKSFNLPENKIIGNYENPTELYEIFEKDLELKIDLSQPVVRYSSALSYVNFLALELYFPNPAIREKLRNSYSNEFDKKLIGLRSVFQPLLEKWDTEYTDLNKLIHEIDNISKEYAERVL